MKKALFKDSIKEIKNTYKRFLSILLMAFLGVGFFAGIRATSPDMVDTIDVFYDKQNVYDIEVVSTLGLTQDDVNELAKIENVEEVQGTFEKDAQLDIGNTEIIVKLLCAENINEPILIEGKLPENSNECVVEASFLKAEDKKIGDILEFQVEEQENDNGEKVQYLKENNMKIVGVVESPLYISKDRGTSTLGTGKVNYYVYISKDNININDIYSKIDIKVKDSNQYKTSTAEYENYIGEVKEKIEEIKSTREKARYDDLISSATTKLEDAKNELNTKKQEGQEKLDDAKKQIDDGNEKIKNAETIINNNEKEANSKFTESEIQISDAKTKLAEGEKKLQESEIQANSKKGELETQKKELEINLETLISTISTLTTQLESINKQLENSGLTVNETTNLITTKSYLESQIETLNGEKSKVEQGIAQIVSGISTIDNELSNAKTQLEDSKTEIEKNENTLKTTKTQTYAKIENSKVELENSKAEIQTAQTEYDNAVTEFNNQIKEAEDKITEAQTKIADIESPTWYVFDRYYNDGYNSFIQDKDSIASIGEVFPIVFFVVATLISLTSMTRMVEEQRMQIGILKALGYNKMQIMGKYIIYALLASVVGGSIGMIIGCQLLPTIIIKMYQMMYQISEVVVKFNPYYSFIGLALICLCIIGATIYSATKELKGTPSVLMRPKPPKNGKRVLLERVTFIWKRLTFSKKVTIRNIFRYKKRVLMTIIGIAGCTALIVTGFGIKDSIKSIIPSQFEKVFNYDMQISLKNGIDDEQKEKYINSVVEDEAIEKYAKTYMTSTTVKNNDLEEDAVIIVPEDENNMQGLINICDVSSKENITMENGKIYLTDKAAQLINVSKGDKIVLKDADDKEIEVTIGNVVENYVSHYVYMTKSTYEQLYGEKYNVNSLLIKNNEMTQEQLDEFTKDLMNDTEVAAITNIATLTSSVDDMMSSLNYVVVILIISAGLLAFVVLYNLANVNISERIRELATIKVLGFYDREVYSYVAKETIILTAIGILLGLIGGYVLNSYIIGTCEINLLRFNKLIEIPSYIYSVLITVVFTIIVNIVTYFSLKKIDMIESLKSVE